ncbi:propanediol utilization protein [Sporosarcina ureae]|uniref:phosphate propanoyltransferase n=1 Tax=Sporosarcina ureae TaxID=1571 RepID=UPI000A14C0F9|nr:phosphate propanoyltransferase [Sporosarcina ureae]ARJ39616.1 propanediol utilization protein [Sporosarcina ureae]
MNGEVIQSIVEDVIKEMTKNSSNNHAIPISISARHCHLCQEDIETLFGPGYELTKKSNLSQPGQFAANETVALIGPRDSIHSVRILGPARSVSQVEVSKTDGIKLGVNPPLRESGEIKDSASITLVGTKGSVYLKEGLIVAKAHIHMHPDDAETLKVSNGEYVKVTVQNERPVTFEKVLIRVSPNYIMDMHIDTDEANAGAIESGSFGKIRYNERENE